MPSPSRAFRWLLRKEWRELTASRSWWVMLVVIGPLVGVAFSSAVRIYSELSRANGTTGGVGDAFSPLIGVWAPLFRAGELAAAFLLPFVAIRLVFADRLSGALKLELQHPMPAIARIAAKVLILLAAWALASIPFGLAILLWRLYGGTTHGPELLAVFGGHLLNAGLTIALACAAAAAAEHPSTAAILTLSVTAGSWMLDLAAAVHGGLWARAARFTQAAVVHELQRGLVRLDAVLIAATLIVAGCCLGAVWMRLGVSWPRRVTQSLAAGVIAALAIVLFARATPSWDLSEAHVNSLSRTAPAPIARLAVADRYQGHPLAVEPDGAAAVFYGLWPAAVLAVAFWTRRRRAP